MTKITIFRNHDGEYLGFDCLGHAGYADEGEDIVCAGISALVINTINSIEQYTEDSFESSVDPETGTVLFKIKDMPVGSSSELLLKSLVLGLNGIQDEYGKKHIKLRIKKQEG